MRDIYEKALQVMSPAEIDHDGTNLYLKVTAESRRLVAEYDFPRQVTTFRSAIAPHDLWYEIAFAYTPGWEHGRK